ncbi:MULTISPECIES: hypothetical protein [unclassified Burkholderia]|uniref:hypothetical protein n=1 Tax=unclassified Burkholderia TaxID=2613784 RepID=UPI000A927496|nr:MULTISPECIES: hypothetical protein [unclassified Burkholderia]
MKGIRSERGCVLSAPWNFKLLPTSLFSGAKHLSQGYALINDPSHVRELLSVRSVSEQWVELEAQNNDHRNSAATFIGQRFAQERSIRGATDHISNECGWTIQMHEDATVELEYLYIPDPETQPGLAIDQPGAPTPLVFTSVGLFRAPIDDSKLEPVKEPQ